MKHESATTLCTTPTLDAPSTNLSPSQDGLVFKGRTGPPQISKAAHTPLLHTYRAAIVYDQWERTEGAGIGTDYTALCAALLPWPTPANRQHPHKAQKTSCRPTYRSLKQGKESEPGAGPTDTRVSVRAGVQEQAPSHHTSMGISAA